MVFSEDKGLIWDAHSYFMRSKEDSHRIVEEVVASMELEGMHPTEEDKMRTFLFVSGKITMDEAMRSILCKYE